MGHPLADGRRDTIALVTHHDDAMRSERLVIDVAPIEQRAVDRHGGGEEGHPPVEVGVGDIHTGDATHGGLHHLRVKGIGCGETTDDATDAKPISDADDGAKIARVLHPIEGDEQLLVIG